MGKRRIMRAFKINEISGVDRPAQEGARAVIMKRDDGKPAPEQLPVQKELAAILTSETDGHQHGVTVNHYDGKLSVYITHANGVDDEVSHNHALALQDGGYALATVAGHTHTIDQTAMASALLALTTKGAGAMPKDESEQTENDDTKSTVEELGKRLYRANRIVSLEAAARKYFDGLEATAQDTYLAKSADDRQAEISAARKAAEGTDPVEYTTSDGVEIRKSAGTAVLAAVKKADEISQENAVLKAEREQDRLEKRATDELAYLPGDVTTRAAMLKAIDGIEDEAHREAAHAALKAQNEAMASAFKTHGVGGQAEPGSPEDGLDKMATDYANEHDITFEAAYNKVIDTPKGKVMIEQMDEPQTVK